MKTIIAILALILFASIAVKADPAPPILAAPQTNAVTHSANLTWTSSTSQVTGYKAYRSTVSGGPYTLQTTLGLVNAWTDFGVQAGTTYFYVLTAFDSTGKESVFSNQIAAPIPAAPAPFAITTTSLAPCVAGSPCAAQLVITGGTAPYAVTISGLPTGLTVSGLGYSGASTVSGSFDLAITATDSAASTPATKTLTLSVSAAPTPGQTQSFWTSTDAPANQTGDDGSSVELGLKFTPNVSGTVVGIKFWKALNSTGTHSGHLWSSGTAALATVNFSNETSSGWQTATFTTPIQVTAGTQYTVSYHTVQYPWNLNYFAAAKSVGNLTAPVSAGSYCYGTSACKPSSTWQASNYWVDVIFQPNSSAPPPITITITPTSTSLQVGQTKQFTYTVANSANTAVTWSATPGCGTVSASGLFSASAVANPCSVTATSVADTTKSASATISVTPPPPTLAVDCAKIPTALTATNIPSGTTFSASITASGITASCSGTLP